MGLLNRMMREKVLAGQWELWRVSGLSRIARPREAGGNPEWSMGRDNGLLNHAKWEEILVGLWA